MSSVKLVEDLIFLVAVRITDNDARRLGAQQMLADGMVLVIRSPWKNTMGSTLIKDRGAVG